MIQTNMISIKQTDVNGNKESKDYKKESVKG